MNVLDIIYIVAIVCALVSGFCTGFLSRISLPAGAAFGLFNATVLMSSTCELLKKHLDWDETAIKVTAFIAVMIASIIAIKLVVAIISWFLKLIGLNIINRIAGAILSVLIVLIVITGIVDFSSVLAPDNSITGKTTQEKSLLYNKVATDIYKKTITRLF